MNSEKSQSPQYETPGCPSDAASPSPGNTKSAGPGPTRTENPAFYPGDVWLTRDGVRARIHAVDGCGNYPILGSIEGTGGWHLESWGANGQFYYGSRAYHASDLIRKAHTGTAAPKGPFNIREVLHRAWTNAPGVRGDFSRAWAAEVAAAASLGYITTRREIALWGSAWLITPKGLAVLWELNGAYTDE